MPEKKIAGNSVRKVKDKQGLADAYPPYRFSPVNVDLAVHDSPVWHDGSSDPDGELISGELRCTLEALTPLLPGNHRYQVDDAKDGQKKWNGCALDNKKQIAEPLRLDGGRVVIPGHSIKGMLRHSLSALLSAPMERVAEHRYTYRPNFGHADHGNIRLECRPAIVTATSNGKVEVSVLPKPKAAVFLHGNAPRLFSKYCSGNLLPGSMSDLEFGVWKKENGNRVFKNDANRISDHSGRIIVLSHKLFSYRGGIDGNGFLASAFRENLKIHNEALVPVSDVNSGTQKSISTEVWKQYLETQRILADDENGHLTNAHPLTSWLNDNDNKEKVKIGIRDATDLATNQLIYVEIEIANGKLGEIRSLGHHYQYRWAYTSSVRVKNGKPRAEVAPLPFETAGNQPKALSAARLLFGYAPDSKTPIGKGAFQRLAGRIAINHAVSESQPEFLDGEKGTGIPLKPLGMPRASAVEFYLKQNDPKKLQTYGDLPGEEGSDLAGRKFYLHQPGAEKGSSYFQATGEHVTSNLATLARYVCKPGTSFRFTIRFARLRPWELGALLVTLQPHLLDCDGKPEEYGHKLGLGRPLGMGSIRITVDRRYTRKECDASLKEADQDLENRAIDALRSKLDLGIPKVKDHVSHWLQIHEYVDRGCLDYPQAKTKVNGKEIDTIYAWHTNVRRKYAKQRREADLK